jgi:nicotinamidase-related amidase
MNDARYFDSETTLVERIAVRKATTAIVVIDMQYHDASPDQGFNLAMERVDPGCMDYFNERNESVVVPSIRRLIESARSHGVSVVYLTLGSEHRDLRDFTPRLRTATRKLEAASGVDDIFWKGNPAFDIRRELAPREGELVVNKTSWGAFNSSDIDQQLSDRGLQTLIMTGISTNCCVETTARDAADRGYGVAIVNECTADYDEAAHEAALRSFHFNFGRVLATVDDAISALNTEATV